MNKITLKTENKLSFSFYLHIEHLFVYNNTEVITMAIRDRGKIKWAAAYLQPEQQRCKRDFWHDTERIRKPIIEEHEAEEFDLRIEVKPGEFERVAFDSVIGVKVVN